MFDKKTYSSYKKFIEIVIDIFIDNHFSTEMKDQMVYMLFGGKRIRPIITLLMGYLDINKSKHIIADYRKHSYNNSIYNVKNISNIENDNAIDIGAFKIQNKLKQNEVGKERSNKVKINKDYEKKIYLIVNNIVIDTAILIELIHCLSLIIDDMPDMDNDSDRRGIKTFHHKYGVDYTKFFVYYIVNKVSLIANRINKTVNKYLLYNYEFTDILIKNLNNLIIGQIQDLHYKVNTLGSSKNKPSAVSATQNSSNPKLRYTKNNSYVVENIISIFIKILDINILTAVQKELFINNIVLNLNKTGSLFQLSSLSYISKFYILNCTKNNNYNIDKLKQIILMKFDDIIKLEHYKQEVVFYIKNEYNKLKNNETDNKDKVKNQTKCQNQDNKISKLSNIPYNNYHSNLEDDIYIKTTTNTKADLKNMNYQYLNSKVINYIHFSLNIWVGILGIIFQYSDDIMDMEKDVGNNPNITNVINKKDVINLIKNISKWLESQLMIIDKKTQFIFNEKLNKDIFIEIIKKINNRCK